jgi:hypothetical protein
MSESSESQASLLTRRAFASAAVISGAAVFVPAFGAPLNVAAIDCFCVMRLAGKYLPNRLLGFP